MGKLYNSVFGGSQNNKTSEQGNHAYDQLSGSLMPQVNQGTSALNGVGALLGFGGDTKGQTEAFNNYKDSSGYNFIKDQGTDAISQNAAAKGLLGSGATLRGISNYGQQTANTFLGDYISRLLGVNQAGTNAAGVVANAGQYGKSNDSSYEKKGIGDFLGSIMGASG